MRGRSTDNPYGAYYALQENSTGKSNYNALQASFRVMGWHGVTSMVNYVYSKSLDNSSDGEDFEPNAAQPNDSTQPNLEYGPSNFNIPHRFTWNFSYEFPNMGGSMQKLKNGWGLNSVVTLQSGQPFHVNYNFWDDYSGSGNAFDRPDVIGPVVYNKRDPLQLPGSDIVRDSLYGQRCDRLGAANGLASDCVIGTRHFGNLGRNSLTGPTFKEWNFSFYKKTNLTEAHQHEAGGRLLQHSEPSEFRQPAAAGLHRRCWLRRQFGLTPDHTREITNGPLPITATGDVGIGNPFIGGGGPRGIQLSAVFKF